MPDAGPPPNPNQEPSPILPQVSGPRLLFAAPGLAQLLDDALVLWDTATWTARTLPIESPRGMGRLADGALLVLDAPAAFNGDIRGSRLPTLTAESERFRGFVSTALGKRSFVLRGAGPDDFAVVCFGAPGAVSRARLEAGGGLAVRALHALPGTDGETATTTENGDVVYPWSGALREVRADGELVEHPLAPPLGAPTLLAAGPPGRIWVSSAHDHLALVTRGGYSGVVWQVSTGASIFHLAAEGSFAAVLLVDPPVYQDEQRWTLVVYEAGVGERWRLDLPRMLRPLDTFLAMGADSVAVGGLDAPRVWALQDGAVLKG